MTLYSVFLIEDSDAEDASNYFVGTFTKQEDAEMISTGDKFRRIIVIHVLNETIDELL